MMMMSSSSSSSSGPPRQDSDGWREVRRPATVCSIVTLEDDDDVQVCSPRSFAKAKHQARVGPSSRVASGQVSSSTWRRDRSDDFLRLTLGRAPLEDANLELCLGRNLRQDSTSISRGRQSRKRVLPATIDLTDSSSEDCEVVKETGKKKKEAPPTNLRLTCAICYDTMKDETSTVCGHIFCGSCIASAIKVQHKCPSCRRPLDKTKVHRIYLTAG